MGFRFRKSISAGPFRINFSKSGIGASVGNQYCRYTKKAGGGTRSTVTLPGTGISYVEDHKSGSSSQKSRRSSARSGSARPTNPVTELLLCLFLGWMGAHRFYRRQFFMGWLYVLTLGCCGIGWIGDLLLMIAGFFPDASFSGKKFLRPIAYVLAFFLLLIPAGCGSEEPAPVSTEPTSVTELTQPTEETLPSETTVPVETTAATESTTVPTDSVPETTAAPTAPETEPPKPTETEPPTEAPTEAPTEPAAPPETEAPPTEPEEETHSYVLNTHTNRFHIPSCSDVKRIKPENREDYTGTRENLISQGYKPCGHCHP